MASLFVLAREDPRGKAKLPGTPVAVVVSERKELNGLFLCIVKRAAGHEDSSDSDDSSSSEEDEATRAAAGMGPKKTKEPSSKDSALHKSKMDVKADVDKTLRASPGALSAAATYRSAGSKRRRGEEEEAASVPEEGGRLVKTKASKRKHVIKRFGKHGAPVDFIQLPIGAIFKLLPPTDPDWRFTAYVPGKSGSGKSMWSADILKLWAALYPDRPIYGVCKTPIKDDPAFDGIEIKQVPIGFFTAGFDVKAAFGDQGCMVLFDDWDSLEDGDVKLIQHVIQDVLNVGRKLKVSCLVTSHLLTNYNQTRGIIHEADYIALFPQSAQKGSLKYLCSKLGVLQDDYKSLKAAGRWVVIHNHEPTFMLTETWVKMT